MPKRRNPVVSALAALTVAMAAAALSGCGFVVTYYAGMEMNDKGNDRLKPEEIDLTKDAFLVEMSERFGLMALLSEAVYRREIVKKDRDAKGCAYLNETASEPDPDRSKRPYGLPQDKDGKTGWMRWTPQPASDAVKPCLEHESGLHYETYVYKNKDGKFEEAVIAFRGTENREGQAFKDWRSNAAAFLGFEPAQYAEAQVHMEPLIQALQAVLEPGGADARIYATGHSLGGGLAQQAGYLSKGIKEVYTFNTTPVTNWSKLRLKEKVANAYPVFHRVYHGGEFLEKVRFVSTSFTGARYNRHDLGVQFQDRTNFGGHSMQILACEFARLIASRGKAAAADHHYPVEYIEHVLLAQESTQQPCAAGTANK